MSTIPCPTSQDRAVESELERERRYVAMLYDELDRERRYAATQLDRVLGQGGHGTPETLFERDAAAAQFANRVALLRTMENRLCFGRLDFQDDTRLYIGRMGLFDENDEYRPLLIDWRAPAARPFYCATALDPSGVSRRRHLRTSGRRVTGFDDELLDIDQVDAADPTVRNSLNGEAVLLAALAERRTGHMSDIVATIQAEQDRIIRSGLSGVLVVQGGPGTGKTAVALHRAAYLLYTYRDQLAKRGVLIVGPNPTFLHYINQVLPSLGETDVLLATVAELYPGVTATATEPEAVAALKGDARMTKVMAAAVRQRQQLPDPVVEIHADLITELPDGEPLRLDKRTCQDARTAARRSRRPHNQARPLFVKDILTALTEQVARRLGRDLLDAHDLAEIRSELTSDTAVTEAVNQLWPTLTPQQLLADFYASPARITAATRGFTAAERELLRRESSPAWTPADMPLLDEAMELLGYDDGPEKAAEARRRHQEHLYAQGVLDILDMDEDLDPELLRAVDIVDPERLAERHRQERVHATTAQRAAEDREWTFGHVIVDEAQELSAMAWRMVMRRCPSRSMTLVGDIAQTGATAGTTSWAEVLEPFVAQRWRLEQLTVNYRTPSEVMRLAADVLPAINTDLHPPRSVRDTGAPPWLVRVGPDELAEQVSRLVTAELRAMGEGRLAVVVPESLAEPLGTQLLDTVSGIAVGAGPEALDSPAVVLTPGQAKGLEFDVVMVIEPDAVRAESERGTSDLYVGLTRATQRLGVVHSAQLPEVLASSLWEHRTPYAVHPRPED